MENEAIEIASNLGEVEENNPLWGIPFVIKDNMSTKDVPTTASSNILKGYIPVFDTTVVEKLKNAKAVPIGKATLDELAMGGTGTSGHLGVTHNPWDESKTRLVGGSSCGSAAATAAGVGGVEAVASPESKAEVEVEMWCQHCRVACGQSAAKTVTLGCFGT